MTWIKFHEELTKGAKRGIKRALRFVYLELSLLARPKGGRVELPLGMGDVEGVIDLLGGDAKEVRGAVKVFTTGPEPMLSFEGEPGARVLVVPKWDHWNELPGLSTDRVKRHRAKVATDMKRVSLPIGTANDNVPKRDGNGPRVEESREEKIDPPVVPQSGDTTKRAKSMRGTRCPSSADPEAPAWLEAHGIPALGSDSGAEAAKMLDHFAALPSSKGAKLDWPATWRNWLRSGFTKVRGPAPGHKPEARPKRQDEPPPSPLMLLGEAYTGPTVKSVADVLAVATGGTLKAENE